jgi:hypothetical protein
MAAAVAPLPQPICIADSSADARKRRREILASQRILTPDVTFSSSPIKEEDVEVAPKKRKVSVSAEDTPTNKDPAKKPQMKYDPDEPMTKEEAAAWRREQRRKRNRESAAASRQRQRDRITELEIELDDCKTKYDTMMDKIAKLEEIASKKNLKLKVVIPEQTQQTHQTHPMVVESKFVSPPSSPGHSSFSSPSPVLSPIASSSLVVGAAQVTPKLEVVEQVSEDEEEQQHSNKMISRLATS